MLTALPIFGCSHRGGDATVGAIALEANEFFAQGNYEASLGQYEKLIEKEPGSADRVLFEMGIIYAHPGNGHKNYQKALECFRQIIGDYPDSDYRRDSQMLMLQIQNVIIKDNLIAEQQKQINTYRRGIKAREDEIIARQKKIGILEQKVFELRTEPADKVLIEKKERRLTLISKGEVIKTYKIALGGQPVGCKERQGDNKTPEGIYTIESRNRHSNYHLSLRLSYPNEKDKKRAKELGVSPGGDIMIHGIKNGLSWIGDFHAGIDWTEGCIAVTNKEMEEIARLVPNGTPVEIRP
jgi:L,D-peptidoglycan transpeptidase YkuD (ErfK/YbiS/YcfS/YnhG family)